MVGKFKDFLNDFRRGRDSGGGECRFDVMGRDTGEDFANCSGGGGNFLCVEVGWELVNRKKWF